MTTDEFTIRPLESHDDYLQCVALQHETWGADFADRVPPSILQVCQKVGGVAAGAFDSDGRLVGFVFGLSGIRHGRLAHWSDMLAVREELRGRGLGQRLKAYQLTVLLERGIEVAYWTYDPLESGNANININRLAAYPVEYLPNMYGEVPGRLHAGLPTDRFIVEWWLSDRRVAAALESPESAAAAVADVESTIVNTETVDGAPTPREGELPDATPARVEIPWEIQATKTESMETALSWRLNTRRALMHYMGRGYRVTGFERDTSARRCFYVLRRGSD